MKGIAIRLALIAAIGIGAFVLRDRLSGNAGDLAAGDCFDVPAASETVEDVQHHPCTESHTAEVVLAQEHEAPDDAAYPTNADWSAWWEAQCIPAFEAYTGLDYATDPNLDIGVFTPTEEGWNDGDRKVICYAARMDGAPMTQSIKAGT